MSKALIIIDMQNEFCISRDQTIKACYTHIIPPINKMVSTFRENGDYIIWLNWGISKNLHNTLSIERESFNQFEYPDSMSWKRTLNKSMKVLEEGSWSSQIISQLNTVPSDIFLSKQTADGFKTSKARELIEKLKVEDLYFSGVNTDQCVESTLRSANRIGYNSFLVKDSTATISENRFEESINRLSKIREGILINSIDVLKSLQ